MLHDDVMGMRLSGMVRLTQLVNCFGTRARFVGRIAAMFMDELENPPHPAQAHVSQALSNALALHRVCRSNHHDAPRERAPRGVSPRSLQRVTDFMGANLHDAVDLQMLATVASVSRFHFARLFRQSTGRGASAYLDSARMRRAQALIRQGRLPLAQIAWLVGYADQSYFTRRFRRVTGVTPTAYARALALVK